MSELSYLIRPNEARPDWPVRSEFSSIAAYCEAIAKVQHKVRYYGMPYDHNIDWREMVWDIKQRCPNDVVWCDPAKLDLIDAGNTVRVKPVFRRGKHYLYVTWHFDV